MINSVINRDLYLNQLIERMCNGAVKVITGIRRCGKSYLLFKIFLQYLKSIGVQEHQIIPIILDDDEYAFLRSPINLGKYIRERVANTDEQYYILIDEIQYCQSVANPDIPNDVITFYEVLNGLIRRDNVDVYVTGSNSQMLSSDILTQFRGRGDQIHVSPLSFQEYQSIHDGAFDDIWLDYCMYGGLPKVALMDNDRQKSEYLMNLFEEVYLKDIIQHNGIKKDDCLNDLLHILASSIGSFTNPTNIEKTFKSRLNQIYSVKTISNHLAYLQEAFLINEVKRYDIKGRKYIGANSKYYFSDIGLRNAMLNFRQQEMSHIMENVIYNELCIRGYHIDVGIIEKNEKSQSGDHIRIYYEVDFVANIGIKKYYIQSAYRMPNADKRAQEKHSLLRIDDSFKKIIITDENVKSYYDDDGILIIGLRHFLMNVNALEE